MYDLHNYKTNYSARLLNTSLYQYNLLTLTNTKLSRIIVNKNYDGF